MEASVGRIPDAIGLDSGIFDIHGVFGGAISPRRQVRGIEKSRGSALRTYIAFGEEVVEAAA